MNKVWLSSVNKSDYRNQSTVVIVTDETWQNKVNTYLLNQEAQIPEPTKNIIHIQKAF